MLPKITELVPVKVAMLERLHTYLSISMLFGYRSAFFLGKIELETLLTRSFTLVKLPTALPNEIFLFIPSGFKLHHVAFFFTLYLDHNPSMMRMRAKSHLDARLAGPVLKTTGLTKKKKKVSKISQLPRKTNEGGHCVISLSNRWVHFRRRQANLFFYGLERTLKILQTLASDSSCSIGTSIPILATAVDKGEWYVMKPCLHVVSFSRISEDPF